MLKDNLTGKEFDAFVAGPGVVLVDLYATWCGPCKRQGMVLEEMAGENPALKIGKVNVDDEQELAVRFQVSAIPALLIFKGGQLKKNFVGLQSKQTLLDAIAEA